MGENNEGKKLLLLKIEGDYPAEVEVGAYDFPTAGEPRRRFRFSVNCGEFDVKRLIREGMDLEAAMEHYREWIYDTIRMYILSEWYTCDDCAELLAAVRKHVEEYYR